LFQALGTDHGSGKTAAVSQNFRIGRQCKSREQHVKKKEREKETYYTNK
jgi:hypothetical protein